MRTASICPTCATYENALCIIYNGDYLPNLDVAPGDSIESSLININNNLVPVVGTVPPVNSATYLGQLYLDTAVPTLYYAESVGSGSGDWVALGDVAPVNIGSGTYIPVLVPGANVTSETAYNTHYMRVEGEVSVQGVVDITATGAFELVIALPISSTFAAATDLSGFTNSSPSYYIEADTITNQAILKGTLVGSETIRFYFTYSIL